MRRDRIAAENFDTLKDDEMANGLIMYCESDEVRTCRVLLTIVRSAR